ncbi:MAG: hypothetical protein EPO07_14460 [Verrucomicrobia bacterium]|nr:MAG: hypothetical protein EPO07_14460 [Verrucomicrobiota bacterium]
MNANPTEIKNGIQAGLTRSLPHFRGKIDRQPDYLYSLLENALRSWPEDSQDRFVNLFAELTTIAAVARVANQEPQLTMDDVRAFLGHSIAFFNSFTHK